MRKKVALVDYGVGNLQSVRWALEAVGANVIQTYDPKKIISADCLVLPGVGAFGHCMEKLRDCQLVEVLQKYPMTGKPMLGICVGMQILLDCSEEFGFYEGLGIVSGEVKKISDRSVDGKIQKVPYIGWNPIYKLSRKNANCSPFDNLLSGHHYYFVHSYSAVVENEENILAQTNYGGHTVVAAIQSGNVFGVQFHPEKSASNGICFLENFLISA